ncbi:helix-turn-helix transcriptional regulator [Clostridium butyricum]|uniref:helix-turn-helix transcriptional regulator n=1 Tax=Clostridium butyricum TaxID=1492 RepID=UPI0022E8438B|nr:helix-turn-helix domain-containing protein [Clostridium butyricum]
MKRQIERMLISPEEAIEILGVSRNMMYKFLLKDKTFPSFTINGGRKVFIDKSKLRDWINLKCQKTAD